MTEPRFPTAVLWDMDGTLVDTEPYWIEAETDLLAGYGKPWSHQQGLALVGRGLLDSGAYIVAETGIPLTPAEVVDELLDRVIEHVRRKVPWCDGALDLLREVGDAGIPQALVTMSYRRFAEPAIAHLPDHTFAAVVTGDAVSSGKPGPEPYLLAAKRLGVDPARCVAVEDSPTGVASAASAGCQVLVVPKYVEVPTGPRRHFVDTLVGLTVADLAALDAAPTRVR